MKSTAPGSLLYHICLCDLFLFGFIFRSINPKTEKYLAAIYSYLFYLAFDLSIYYNFISRPFAYLEAPYPEGIDNPFIALVASSLFVCVGAVHVVLRGSPIGSITLVLSLREIPTIDVLHHSFLFGEIPT